MLNGVCHTKFSIARAGSNYMQPDMHFWIGGDILRDALIAIRSKIRDMLLAGPGPNTYFQNYSS